MDLPLFEQAADLLRGLVPRDLGTLRCRARRYGMKVWLGPERPPRVHFEAQVIGAGHCPGARVLALEIGFHSEHPDARDNDAVLARITCAERKWRRSLGPEPEIGEFLGRQEWRRVSETWPDPDLDDAELAFEVAARLTDYVTALAPLLEGSPAGTVRASAGRPRAGR